MNPTREQFAGWHKSSFSTGGDNGGCVGIGYAPSQRGIEDTKLKGSSPIIAVSETAFRSLLAAAKDGRLG